jgi:hypothetical protein
MKKFRDLRQNLTEDSESYYDAKYRVGPLGGNNEVDQADAAIFDLARPESVRRINTYLGAAGAKPVLDPNGVLRQIQRKLAIIGLQFSIPTSDLGGRARYGFDQKGDIDDGGVGTTVKEYPLSYLGGRFGVLDNMGKIGYDDNISHRLGHGLVLQVTYQNTKDGATTVMPKIVHGSPAQNIMKAPGMLQQALERMKSMIPTSPKLNFDPNPLKQEEYTTQKTGMTVVPPKPSINDDTVRDTDKGNMDTAEYAQKCLERMKAMTPGSTAVASNNQQNVEEAAMPSRSDQISGYKRELLQLRRQLAMTTNPTVRQRLLAQIGAKEESIQSLKPKIS